MITVEKHIYAVSPVDLKSEKSVEEISTVHKQLGYDVTVNVSQVTITVEATKIREDENE